jgi:hypothetical protein
VLANNALINDLASLAAAVLLGSLNNNLDENNQKTDGTTGTYTTDERGEKANKILFRWIAKMLATFPSI